MRWLFFALVAIAACGDSSPANPSGGSSGVPNSNGTSSSSSGGSPKDGGAGDDDDVTDDDDDVKPPPAGPANVRIMAANLTSGNGQSYDPGHGTRIFEALKADIVLIQEFRIGDNTAPVIDQYVTTTFGPTYTYFRETGFNIPNGVISRFPIVSSGHIDSGAPDRGFAWAKITVPGTHPLYAFSVHLRTANATTRNTEATALVGEIKKMVLPGDYVVIGGDLNTEKRGEACVATFGELVATAAPHPADQKGNENTNAPRGKPLDWVLASPNLVANQVPTVLGMTEFADGLVFDSRVYTPLEEVAPVQSGDSGANGMQHMAVVKDFHLE